MDYIKPLHDLRNALANNGMSVLVGSGFSKNVSAAFPTWDELLYDLTYEVYQSEIEKEYGFMSIINPDAGCSKEAFTREKIREYLKRDGYLSIVSRFIRQRGFPESIVTYIEERTPSVETVGGKRCLLMSGWSEELQPEKLVLHRTLLQLPWNNIFTTNYDHLLEISVNLEQYEVLTKEKRELESSLVELRAAERELRLKQQTIDGSRTDSEPVSLVEKELEAENKAPSNGATDTTEIRDVQLNTTTLDIREKEERLLVIESLLQNCFTLVTNAGNLRIKRTKNIIKLHGSLRKLSERSSQQFGFDGDPAKQYVIAEEHYAEYPKKHEAFTQLMRISLLQESFCLIGFSGSDPNFHTWIHWIRDLLSKYAQEHKNAVGYKLYLIDLSKETVTSDKLLFYENHSIVRIPLLHPSVQQFLEGEDKLAIGEDNVYATAIGRFLSFLGNHKNIQPMLPVIPAPAYKSFRHFWDRLPTTYPTKAVSPPVLQELNRKLEEMSKRKVIGDLDYRATHQQHSLIHLFHYVYTEQKEQFPESVPQLLRLLLFAIEDYKVPLLSTLPKAIVDELLACPLTKEKAEQLVEQDEVLRNPLQQARRLSEGEVDYRTIQSLAFSFQFGKLLQALQAWEPELHERHLKAGFLGLFDVKEAEIILTEQLREEEGLLPEQALYSTEMLSVIRLSSSWQKDDIMSRRVQHYEQAGYVTFSKQLDRLIETVSPKFPKPEPYDKVSVSQFFELEYKRTIKRDEALQYLNLLLLTGFQLSYPAVILESSNKWYPVFATGFETYPLPYLFYSLQYGEEKFLKRIGQDVAFSSLPNEEVSHICKTVLQGYMTAPPTIQENILAFVSQFFVAVSAAVWQNEFLEIGKDLIVQQRAFADRSREASIFIEQGVQFIDDSEVIVSFIEALLAEKRHAEGVILVLYHMNGNPAIKQLSWQNISDSLRQKIEALIAALPSNPETNIFLLGNLHQLLSEQQSTQITAQLRTVNFSSIANERIWRPFFYFAQSDPQILSQMKTAIINHPQLWHTGIKGRSIEGGGKSYLSIVSLTKRDNKEGLSWTGDEALGVYQKMKPALRDIERLRNRGNDFFSFASVLEEMRLFVHLLENELQHEADYWPIKNLIDELYANEAGYNSIEDGLTSNDTDALEWALREMDIRVHFGQVREDEIVLILNRIWLQIENVLLLSLSYVRSWMHLNRAEALLRSKSAWLVKILRKFQTKPVTATHMPHLEEQLVAIAAQLQNWDEKDESIDWWIAKGKASRFNNCRHIVAGAVSEVR